MTRESIERKERKKKKERGRGKGKEKKKKKKKHQNGWTKALNLLTQGKTRCWWCRQDMPPAGLAVPRQWATEVVFLPLTDF